MNDPIAGLSPSDQRFLQHAVELALETEQHGNLPVAAVITLQEEIVATAANRVFAPEAHPARHAEVLALAAIPEHLIPRLREMTCYCTLEPCLMCFGALILHGIGRVVFGAWDPRGGALSLLQHLPPYVADKAKAIDWVGPAWAEVCDPLCERALSARDSRRSDSPR